MKRVIRLGDQTSHGGVVVSASSTTNMFGKPVALLGDKVSCPVHDHGVCPIIEGDTSWNIGGKSVALEGHKTSCGAVLISSMPEVGRSYEGSGAASSISSSTGKAIVAAATTQATEDELEYYFMAVSENGTPLNLAYRIDSGKEKLHQGLLSADGITSAFPMESKGDATFWIPQA